MKKLLLILIFLISFQAFGQLVPAMKLNNANFYGGIWVRDSIWGLGKLKFTGSVYLNNGKFHYISDTNYLNLGVGTHGWYYNENPITQPDGTETIFGWVLDQGGNLGFDYGYRKKRSDVDTTFGFKLNSNQVGLLYKLSTGETSDIRILDSGNVWFNYLNENLAEFGSTINFYKRFGINQNNNGYWFPLHTGATGQQLQLSGDSLTWVTPTTTYQRDKYSINLFTTNFNPADSTGAGGTNYFFSCLANQPVALSSELTRLYFHSTDTIRSVNLTLVANTTIGTGEGITLYIRKNNTTDYLVSKVYSAANNRRFINYSMLVPLVSGDFIEMKAQCPIWNTNPVGVQWFGNVGVNY